MVGFVNFYFTVTISSASTSCLVSQITERYVFDSVADVSLK